MKRKAFAPLVAAGAARHRDGRSSGRDHRHARRRRAARHGAQADRISAFAGNDAVYARGGADDVRAGAGNDGVRAADGARPRVRRPRQRRRRRRRRERSSVRRLGLGSGRRRQRQRSRCGEQGRATSSPGNDGNDSLFGGWGPDRVLRRQRERRAARARGRRRPGPPELRAGERQGVGARSERPRTQLVGCEMVFVVDGPTADQDEGENADADTEADA